MIRSLAESRQYISGQQCAVLSDHASLRRLQTAQLAMFWYFWLHHVKLHPANRCVRVLALESPGSEQSVREMQVYLARAAYHSRRSFSLRKNVSFLLELARVSFGRGGPGMLRGCGSDAAGRGDREGVSLCRPQRDRERRPGWRKVVAGQKALRSLTSFRLVLGLVFF